MWNRTDKPIPGPDGVKLDEKILEGYVGTYEMTPEFIFSITRVTDRLFVQATGQDQLEMFAESEMKFFLKVNDAQFEFVADDSGRNRESDEETTFPFSLPMLGFEMWLSS